MKQRKAIEFVNYGTMLLIKTNDKNYKLNEEDIKHFESMPRYLYKYRKFDQYTIEMIENSYFYLSQADKLDDQFDCTFKIEEHFKSKVILDFLFANKQISNEEKMMIKKFSKSLNKNLELLNDIEYNSFHSEIKKIIMEECKKHALDLTLMEKLNTFLDLIFNNNFFF